MTSTSSPISRSRGAGARFITVIDGGSFTRVFDVLGGTVEISGVMIRNGFSSDAGGGIRNAADLVVTNSNVGGNTASLAGGGIFNTGSLTVTRSVLHDNLADTGAGINNQGFLAVTSSTLSVNGAFSIGGAIHNIGTARLNNVTVAKNETSSGGVGGGIVSSDPGAEMTLSNTILAENLSDTDPNCVGTLTSAGYNLIVADGCDVIGDPTGNIAGNPNLAPLDFHGAQTVSHALLPGSPAIDAGNPADLGSSLAACEFTDQRGVSRRTGVCDIGAFEVASLTGRVSEEDGVTPIANAQVFAHPQPPGGLFNSAVTDLGGFYGIAGLSNHTYQIEVQAEGYATEWFDNQPTSGRATPSRSRRHRPSP